MLLLVIDSSVWWLPGRKITSHSREWPHIVHHVAGEQAQKRFDIAGRFAGDAASAQAGMAL